jgi:hypothetical protein
LPKKAIFFANRFLVGSPRHTTLRYAYRFTSGTLRYAYRFTSGKGSMTTATDPTVVLGWTTHRSVKHRESAFFIQQVQ